MFCPGCGKSISADSAFCEFCGTRSVAAAYAPQAVASVPAAPRPEPQLSREQLGKMLWSSLTGGERFIACGALAGLVGFFLPWGSIPSVNGMALNALSGGVTSGVNGSSYSGFDLARMWGGLYFIFLGALAAGILFFMSGRAPTRKRLILNAFQILIGTLAGPQMLAVILFTPMAQGVAGMGWWMTCLGYCSIAAGGVISVTELSRRITA